MVARRPRPRPTIAVALLDVDEFAQINEQYGSEEGDRVLHAIAQLIEVQQQGESILSHFIGQQVFMLFPDADVRYATGVAERIRQTIEATRFECEGKTDLPHGQLRRGGGRQPTTRRLRCRCG